MAKLKHFSGTPVSEGVRLEVGKYTVFAVRNAKKDISVRMRREPRNLLRAFMRIPFLRGMVRLIRDIVRFFDGLSESAELNPQHPVKGTRAEQAIAQLLGIHSQTLVAWVSALTLLPLAAICLYAAPEGTELFLQQRFALPRVWLNVAVCGVRILGALTAIACAGRLRVFRRLLMYKGALNKALNCYECRDEMTPENVARYPLHTRRSEPAFLLCILILSLISFVPVKVDGLLVNALVRILIVLLIAAIWNEAFSALERARLTLPVRILRAPIDLLQHMAVLEPHPQMVEVALCAFEAALAERENEVSSD